MKLILRSSYIIFLLGLTLKFFHIHYNALLMMAGLAGVLFVTVARSFSKENKPAVFTHAVILVWLVQLFISVKFFPVGNVVMWIAMGITVVYGFYFVRRKQVLGLLPVLTVALLTVFIWSMPLSDRYRVFNINWNYEKDTDLITWDKYSWFLYRDGRYEEAQNASDKALEIAESVEEEHWIELIREHNQSIRTRNWIRYR